MLETIKYLVNADSGLTSWKKYLFKDNKKRKRRKYVFDSLLSV